MMEKEIRREEKTQESQAKEVWVPLRHEDLDPERIKVIGSVLDTIPALPVSVQEIIQMASDSSCGAKEIAEVAAHDPVLVSNILMTVNSSYYSLSRKIDNLRLAIVLLGFKEVRNIAIQCGLSHAFKDLAKVKGFDTRNLWVHSNLVSICAESFVSEDDPQRGGILLTMGMLHDIGKYALFAIGLIMKRNGVSGPKMEAQSQASHLLQKEELYFGVNHSIVGGLLARKWNLSERIGKVLECHHYPSFFGISEVPQDHLEDITAICIADLIVNQMSHPGMKLKYPHPVFFSTIGVDPDIQNSLTPELERKLIKARNMLDNL
jgi:HD-like signal output (HDOD) protein